MNDLGEVLKEDNRLPESRSL